MEEETLPFLVVNGDWFCFVLVAVFGAALFVAFVLLRAAFARRRKARTLQALREHTAPELGEGHGVTLAGHWTGETLDVRGEKVLLGITQIAWPGPKPRIEVGDAVFVTGDLLRTPSSETVDRANPARWRLDGAIVYSGDTRVRRWRLGWVTGSIFVGLALLVSYSTLVILGRGLVDGIRDRDGGDGRPLALSNLDAASIASALPWSRDDALDRLAKELALDPFRDEASVERQRRLARIRDGDCEALWFLAPSGRYDEELDLARRCGARRTIFDLEVAKGDYAGAWAGRPKLDLPAREGMVAITVGDWKSAADAAERMAVLEKHQANYPDQRTSALALEHRYRCLSKWFSSLAGDTGTADALRVLGSDRAYHPLVCAPIVAQTLTGTERKRYLLDALEAPGQQEYSDEAVLARTLLWIDGQYDRDFELIRVPNDMLEDIDPRAWLLGLGAEQWRGKDAESYVVSLWTMAMLDVQRGDFISARRVAEEAVAVAGDGGDGGSGDSGRYLATQLRSVVALREGSVTIPRSEDGFDGLVVRGGGAPRFESHEFTQHCAWQATAARISAQHGDGRPLAIAMQSCSELWFPPQVILGLLPLVKAGRTEVATVLRWWTGSYLRSHEPFASASRASFRRDLARLVGDTPSAERWGRIAAALSAPMEDPTRRIALVLWICSSRLVAAVDYAALAEPRPGNYAEKLQGKRSQHPV